MTLLLEGHMLRAGYDAGLVLDGLSVRIPSGTAVALIGRNGMGKTTLLRTLAGVVPLRGGWIEMKGEKINGLSARQRARAGIALVPEGREIFPNLTVAEHLLVAARPGPDGRRDWTPARVLDLFPRLAERTSHWGDQLSGGEQQMLAIGRALTTNPLVLLLDEATEGLAPRLCREIWTVIATLRDEGLGILVVDKNVEALADLAEHMMILEKGRAPWAGPPEDLDPDTLKRHVGL